MNQPNAIQKENEREKKLKLPFGGAQGAVFDFSLPAERNAMEPK